MPDTPINAPRSRLRRAWPWLLVPLAIGLWALSDGSRSGLPPGELAPPLELPWTASEAPFDLAAQRGHVTVLAFWATWCPACRQEGPVLSKVQARIAPHGDSVVGVSIDDAPLEAIADAARRLGMTYPIAKGTRQDTTRFAVELLPTVLIIGPDGKVTESFAGAVGESRLVAAVEAARR